MAAKFTVFKDKGGHYRFHLQAANGEIIAASQSYDDKKTALKGIASVIKCAAVAKVKDETGEDEVPKKAAKAAVKKSAAPKEKSAVSREKPAASKAKTAAPKEKPAS